MNRRSLLFSLTLLAGLGTALAIITVTEGFRKKEAREPIGIIGRENEREEEGKKSDRPDGYSEFHRQIRTPIGSDQFSYDLNYKIKEMQKAGIIDYPQLSKTSKRLGKATLNWIERGPANVAGRTRGLIVDPSDGTHSTWWAGSVSGGIWKTTNKGTSWTIKTPDVPNLATTSLVMAASNSNIMYAGTGEGFFNVDAVDGNGILKSTNHGESWSQLPATAGNADFQNVNRLIVSPTDPDIILAATNNGVYKSTNGGTSWTQVYGPTGRVQHIIADPTDFNKQWATINANGSIRSTNAGDSWTTSTGLSGARRMEIAVAPTDPSRLYIAAEVGSSPNDSSFMFVSDDAGATWSKVKSNPYQNWLGGQGWYDNTLAVHPFSKDTVFLGGIGLHKFTMLAGSAGSQNGITGIDEENTSSFLSFVSFSGGVANGIGFGENYFGGGSYEITSGDTFSVEIRFGSGKSQKAHRVLRNFDGSDAIGSPVAGIGLGNYAYLDYIDVPFEAWDITNNRQLMVSFLDSTRSVDTNHTAGFNLSQWSGNFDVSIPREAIFIHSIPYNATTPSDSIKNGHGNINGHKYKNIYVITPALASGATWNPSGLPTSVLRINFGTITLRNGSMIAISDPYGRFNSSNQNVHVDHHNLVMIPIDQGTNSFGILNANDGGLAYSSNSGSTWAVDQSTVKGYNTAQFYGVDKKPGSNQYIGGTQDNGTWISPADPTLTSNWTEAPVFGDGFDAVWHYTNPSLVLGCRYDNIMFKSTNGGTSFNLSVSGLLDFNNDDSPFITQIGRSKMEPDIVFTTGRSGVWRSINFGGSWALASGITSAKWGFIPNGATYVEVSLINPQVVWAAKAMSSTLKVFLSTDGGFNFKETNSYASSSWYLSGLATHPYDENTAYALFSVSKQPKILRTTNQGQSWQDLTGFNGSSVTSANGFPDVATYSLLVMPHNTNEIWAGTEIGLFISTDNGATWSYANNGLPPVAIWEMWIVDQQVVVATHGRGIWSVDIPQIPYPLIVTPRVKTLNQTSNMLAITVSQRSVYDSTLVRVDSVNIHRLPSNAAARDTTVNFTVAQTKTLSIDVWSYKNGITYKSAVKTFNAVAADLTPPVLTLAALASPVTSVVRFVISANENLTAASLTVNGASVPMTKQGLMYFGSYTLSSSGSLSVVANGTDGNSNVGSPVNRSYNVSPLSKTTNFANYEVKGSGEGYLMINIAGEIAAPPHWTRIGESVEMLSTGQNRMLNVQASYAEATGQLLSLYPDFDENKIGIYEYSDGAWKHTGGVGKNGAVVSTFKGTSMALFYNPDYEYIPKEFVLEQNYPNPFNPSTTIRYEIPKESRVVIKVYNLLGQEVKTLVNKTQGRGIHTMTWDGKDNTGRIVASGVYLYRLEAGSFVKSRKMLFIK